MVEDIIRMKIFADLRVYHCVACVPLSTSPFDCAVILPNQHTLLRLNLITDMQQIFHYDSQHTDGFLLKPNLQTETRFVRLNADTEIEDYDLVDLPTVYDGIAKRSQSERRFVSIEDEMVIEHIISDLMLRQQVVFKSASQFVDFDLVTYDLEKQVLSRVRAGVNGVQITEYADYLLIYDKTKSVVYYYEIDQMKQLADLPVIELNQP